MTVRTMKNYTAPRGLPRKTRSLCPVCLKVIKAVVKEKDGKVIMEKSCDEHGAVWDIISTDVDHYLRMENNVFDGVGNENPYYTDFKGCPTTCGLCEQHKSHTGLAIVDLTNRCNLKCPICFANANSSGSVYEPSWDQVKFMLDTLRAQKPVGTVAVQFSGGEPTLSPYLLDACKYAFDTGFTQIQIATNGIRLARDPGYAQELVDNRLHTVYLQFDGMDDKMYKEVRGVPMSKIKAKAIDNCRNVGLPKWADPKKYAVRPLSVMLVPTMVKGYNDHLAMPIVDYALENSDTVRGVNYQPVSLTSRLPDKERFSMRYTQADLVRSLCEEGAFEKVDFFPTSVVAPLSQLTSIIHGSPKLTLTCHPGCGCATFAIVQGKEIVPIPRFMDVAGFFESVNELIEKNRDVPLARIRAGIGAYRKLVRKFSTYFDFTKTPEGMNEKNVIKLITAIFSEGDKSALAEFTWNTMFIGNMHFQDAYNYDIQRLMRCQIHYPVPDGRVIPFCAYNSGPIFRDEVEEKFCTPIDEWLKQRRENAKAKKETLRKFETIGTSGEVAVESKDYE